MNTSDNLPVPDSRSRSSWGLPAWLVILPVAYVLSTGPAIRLAGDSQSGWRVVEVIYAPLGWAMKNNGQFDKFMTWYLCDVWQWHPYYPK